VVVVVVVVVIRHPTMGWLGSKNEEELYRQQGINQELQRGRSSGRSATAGAPGRPVPPPRLVLRARRCDDPHGVLSFPSTTVFATTLSTTTTDVDFTYEGRTVYTDGSGSGGVACRRRRCRRWFEAGFASRPTVETTLILLLNLQSTYCVSRMIHSLC